MVRITLGPAFNEFGYSVNEPLYQQPVSFASFVRCKQDTVSDQVIFVTRATS